MSPKRKARIDADHRARQFLMEHLTRWQRFTFRVFHCFTAKGSTSGRKYLLANEMSVLRLRPHTNYCFHAFDERHYRLPPHDELLAKKILIECDEQRFLSTANEF